MSLAAVSVQKISAARQVAGQACELAFDRVSDRRACRLGNELMVTALAGQQEIEMDGLGKVPKGWREKKLATIECAAGSMRTKTLGPKTRLLVCCPRGPGHYKGGRCKVGMRAVAKLEKAPFGKKR